MLLFKASSGPKKLARLASVVSAFVGFAVLSTGFASATSSLPFAPGLSLGPDQGMNALLINQSGPLSYLVYRGHEIVKGAKLVGSMTEGTNGQLQLPWIYPGGGIEALELVGADGVALAQIFLHIDSEAYLSPVPVWSPSHDPSGTFQTGTSAPLSDETSPLTNRLMCETESVKGSVWSVAPLHAIDLDVPLDSELKVLIRFTDTPVTMTKGNRKTFRADQSGKPCSVLKNGVHTQNPTEYCQPPIEQPGAAPTVKTAKLGIDFLGSGGSAQVSWWSMPYKRTSFCDIYKCENGVLAYDYSRTCVRKGDFGWAFTPDVVHGLVVRTLLGYSPDGWKWENSSRCYRVR